MTHPVGGAGLYPAPPRPAASHTRHPTKETTVASQTPDSTESTAPVVGDPVVVLYGPPSEMTWDDSGADVIGVEGVLTKILGEGWLAPFVVTTPDGRTVYASQIRAAGGAA